MINEKPEYIKKLEKDLIFSEMMIENYELNSKFIPFCDKKFELVWAKSVYKNTDNIFWKEKIYKTKQNFLLYLSNYESKVAIQLYYHTSQLNEVNFFIINLLKEYKNDRNNNNGVETKDIK